MYDLVVFDLDNTLFDFYAAQEHGLKKTCEVIDLSYSIDLLQEFDDLNKLYWGQFEKNELTKDEVLKLRFQTLLENHNVDIDPVKTNNIYFEFLSDHAELLDGAHDICAALVKKVPLGIITNGVSWIQNKKLGGSSIKEYFQFMVVSEDVGVGKPHPPIYQAALDRISLKESSKVLMIGDNLVADVKGAQDFGFDGCWYNPDENSLKDGIVPNFTISHLAELKEIIE